MINIDETYTTPEEYEQVVGVNLGLELAGSSDHPERDAQSMIFRVEKTMTNYLTRNYDFTKSLIEENEKTTEAFKLAVIWQIEWFITHGITTPTAVDEYAREHPKFICEAAEDSLHTHGMMNIRTGW